MQKWSFKAPEYEPQFKNMPPGARPKKYPYRPATPRPQEK